MSSVLHIILDIECALLGHCLTENEAYLEAQPITSAADFGLASHGLIFRAIGTLLASGRSADMVTLVQHLRERDELEGIGGRRIYLRTHGGARPQTWSRSVLCDADS